MKKDALPAEDDRRGADALAVLASAEALDAHLTTWQLRDDTKAQPEVRRAATDAVDAIDVLLRSLHTIRARLLGEIRESDDASAARVDALLADLRKVGA